MTPAAHLYQTLKRWPALVPAGLLRELPYLYLRSSVSDEHGLPRLLLQVRPWRCTLGPTEPGRFGIPFATFTFTHAVTVTGEVLV